jgi:uncharacterized membrane protein YkoI
MMLTRLYVRKAKSVITMILCGVLASMPVAAQHYSYDENDGMMQFGEERIYLAQADVESLDSAVARIRNQTGGRVLSAETKNEGGVQVHYIRVLTKSGKVKRFRVVAQPRQ